MLVVVAVLAVGAFAFPTINMNWQVGPYPAYDTLDTTDNLKLTEEVRLFNSQNAKKGFRMLTKLKARYKIVSIIQ